MDPRDQTIADLAEMVKRAQALIPQTIWPWHEDAKEALAKAQPEKVKAA